MPASGLYRRTGGGYQYEARLDVDGDYPQMKVSYSMTGPGGEAFWIADLVAVGDPGWQGAWEGPIFYRRGVTWRFRTDGSITTASEGDLPDRIKVRYGWNPTVGYFVNIHLEKSGTTRSWGQWCQRISDHFRDLEAEFDFEEGVSPVTSFQRTDTETLSVAQVYGKAGVRLTASSSANAVPISEAGADKAWTRQEMHDAMQNNWSAQEAKAWKMWVFSAGSMKQDDPNFVTFGIMFDTIGSFQRSGTAVFLKSIQSFYRTQPKNIRDRNAFRTLVHEMGHAFNLLHSWQKELGTPWSSRVHNEPEARSFMNYPYKVKGEDAAYWANFEYRFSDQELLFLRHAPEDFVIMGGRGFGSDHGAVVPAADLGRPPGLELVVRTNKPAPVYEFMEVVNLELKLKNGGGEPREVPQTILADHAHMGVTVRRNRGPVKEYEPYAITCYGEQLVTMKPGDKLYGSLFLSAGKFGWVVSEPGTYEVVVSLHLETPQGEEVISSNVFEFAVLEPSRVSRQERREREILAQDYFNEDVGRTLAFGGSLVLGAANDVLQEVTERHPESNAATHAALTLKMPQMHECKVLEVHPDGSKSIKIDAADAEAGADAHRILTEHTQEVRNTLGNIAFKQTSDSVVEGLQELGADKHAAAVARNVAAAFKQAGIKLPRDVARDVQDRIKGVQVAAKARSRKATPKKAKTRKASKKTTGKKTGSKKSGGRKSGSGRAKK